MRPLKPAPSFMVSNKNAKKHYFRIFSTHKMYRKIDAPFQVPLFLGESYKLLSTPNFWGYQSLQAQFPIQQRKRIRITQNTTYSSAMARVSYTYPALMMLHSPLGPYLFLSFATYKNIDELIDVLFRMSIIQNNSHIADLIHCGLYPASFMVIF